MKKTYLILLALLLPAAVLFAQKDYKLVIDLTSKDSASQVSAMRWATEVSKADPSAQVEVVMYGKGIFLAVKEKSYVADAVTELAKNKNVSFKVCAVALTNQKFDKSQLLPGVQTVPDGIYEIITKQREGWGYIKVAVN